MKEAQSRQPDIQNLADRISAYFVPAVIANAVFWGVVWYLFPEVLSGFVDGLPLWGLVAGDPVAAGSVSVFEFAIIVFASAVLIACSCALGLATPAVTMVGTTLGAQNGVLFMGGDILEQAKDVDTVVFDKTGTLTKGEMELTDVVFGGDGQPVADGGDPAADGGQLIARKRLSEDDVLRLAGTAESGSEHPLTRVIVVDIDPTKTRPAAEALVRQALQGKPIPTINTFVDACNLASLTSKVPLAAFDHNRLGEKLCLRFAEEGETFLGIGMDNPMTLTGEVLTVDDGNSLIAIYLSRNSADTKITLGTTDVFVLVCGAPVCPPPCWMRQARRPRRT